MSQSELTNTIEQFIVYVHRLEAHFTYTYVYHTNVSEADNIYKNPPPNVISYKVSIESTQPIGELFNRGNVKYSKTLAT